MLYRLTPAPRFEKQLRKLDRSTSRRILVALYELAELEDPTVRLKPLRREFAGLSRLWVDDHRVVLDVRTDEVVIVAIDVGHKRSIYR